MPWNRREWTVWSVAFASVIFPLSIGSQPRTATTPKVVEAANKFLATLSDAERAKCTFGFNSSQRTGWSNLPSGIFPRNGLRLGDLTAKQREAALALVATALSRDGYQKVTARIDAATADAERGAGASRDAASKPSLPLTKYAGTYRDAWYGDITIAQEGGKLVIRFSRTPLLVGDLEHWQHDTFIARWRDRELRADAYLTFALNPDGSIDQAKMRAVSPATDFSFDFQDLLLKPARP